MAPGAGHQKRAITAGAIIGAAWLALIVATVVVLGPVVGLLVAVWGVSLLAIAATLLWSSLARYVGSATAHVEAVEASPVRA